MLNLKSSHLFSDNVKFLEEVEDDLGKIDGSLIRQIVKAINKIAANPRPNTEGGLGKPLKNANGNRLSGFNKIKLLKAGVRIIYQLKEADGKILVIIIATRADGYAYNQAVKRIEKHNL